MFNQYKKEKPFSGFGGFGGGGLGLAGGGPLDLFEFDTATFTALTRSQDGPSLSEAKTLCTGTSAANFKNDTTFFNVSSGILLWTVPTTKTFRIKAAGSRGGPNYDYNFSVTQDSRGAIMQAEFDLSQGDTLAMVIGSEGDPGYGNQNTGSCAGGGTFIWIGDSSDIGGNTLLLAAGGGASALSRAPRVPRADGAAPARRTRNGRSALAGLGIDLDLSLTSKSSDNMELAARALVSQRIRHRCFDKARGNHIHGDAATGNLGSQGFAKAYHAGF